MASKGTNSTTGKRQKRKKKNSRFLHNAKGFAKQGIYGRGAHIDDDQYNYFINILDAMKAGFDDIEDKVNMANNVFAQTHHKEIHLASNQIVCKALEALVGFVDTENLERFFSTFGNNFRPVCSDRFASHVLQKMVEIAFLRTVSRAQKKSTSNSVGNPDDDGILESKRAKTSTNALMEEEYNLRTNFTQEHKQKCSDFVLRVGKFLLNNLEDFVWDSCANHIMRTCILSLAGMHVAKIAFEKGIIDITKNRKLYSVPEEWQETVKEFSQRLEMWPHFSDFPYQEHSSALLGTICVALKVVDKRMLKHLGKKILMNAFLKVDAQEDSEEKLEKKDIVNDNEGEEENKSDMKTEEVICTESDNGSKLPKVFECQSSVILLETLITVAGPKLLTQIYAMLFTGRLYLLSQQALTNFAVQRLLQKIKEKDDFEGMFAELAEHVEELLKIGHTGVIAELTSACLRLQSKQAQMVVSLQTALHTAGDKSRSKAFFDCLIKLKPFEILQEDKTHFIHLHGSLIVQDILRFNKPIFLVNCILEKAGDQLVTIFNTPNGSHICDAFLQSKFIGEKSREKLIRHLEGFYIDLAVTKFGSRVVESCFAAAQDGQKGRIVKELADKSNMLKGTPFGRVVNRKLRVETYRLSASQWKASLQHKESKVQKLFKDIIN